jgi:hypothetical protein
MVRCKEMAASAIRTVAASMDRWQQGNLHDDESRLIAALQVIIDLSGGLRWIERERSIQFPLVAPMRAGEFASFDWKQYRCELCIPYQGINVWLTPDIGTTLMVNAAA